MEMRELERRIASYKKKLVAKAKRKGIYENFGQDEVRKLRDFVSWDADYAAKIRVIDEFDNWVSTYEG